MGPDVSVGHRRLRGPICIETLRSPEGGRVVAWPVPWAGGLPAIARGDHDRGRFGLEEALPTGPSGSARKLISVERARVDEIVDGIYRISIWSPEAGLTFNQFLIDDDAPTLVHTGRYDDYEAVVGAISEVLDPTQLAQHRALALGG